MKTFEPNTVILKEGEPIKHIFIVRSGECQASKVLIKTDNTLNREERHNVILGVFGPLDYFGEEALVSHFKNDNDDIGEYKSQMWVSTLEDPVTLGLITIHDAFKRFPRDIKLSSASESAQGRDKLIAKFLDTKQRKNWEIEKRKMMDALYRERSNDPCMTREKYQSGTGATVPFKF